MIASAPLSTQASRTNENGLARRRSPSRRHSWKRASFQSALFRPIVELGLGCAVAICDELLRRTICEQARDLGTIRIEFAFARSRRPSEYHSLRFLEAQGLLSALRNEVAFDPSSHRKGHRDDFAVDALV